MKIMRRVIALLLTIGFTTVLHCPPMIDMKSDFAKLVDKKPEEVSDWFTKSMRERPEETRKALTDLLENDKTRQQTQDVFIKGMQEIIALDAASHVTEASVKQVENYLNLLDSNKTFLQLEARLPEKLRPTEVLTKLTQTYAQLLEKQQDPDIKRGLASKINEILNKANAYFEVLPTRTATNRDSAATFAEKTLKALNQNSLQERYSQNNFLENSLNLASKALHDYSNAQGNFDPKRTLENMDNVVDFIQKIHDLKISTGTISLETQVTASVIKALDTVLSKLKAIQARIANTPELVLKANQIKLLMNLIKTRATGSNQETVDLFKLVTSPEAATRDPKRVALFNDMLKTEATRSEKLNQLLQNNEILALRNELVQKSSEELRTMSGTTLGTYWENWKAVLLSKLTNPVDNINAINQVLTKMAANYHDLGTNPENLNAYYAMSRNLLRYAIENNVPADVMQKAINPITWLIGPSGVLAQPTLVKLNLTKGSQENKATIMSREYIQTLNILSSILQNPMFAKISPENKKAVLGLQQDAANHLSNEAFRKTVFTDLLVTDAMRSTMFKSAIEMVASAEKAGGKKLKDIVDALSSTNDPVYLFNLLDGLNKAVIDAQQKNLLNETRIDLIKALAESDLKGLSADQRKMLTTTIQDMIKSNIPQANNIALSLIAKVSLEAKLTIYGDMLIALIDSYKAQGRVNEITKLISSIYNAEGVNSTLAKLSQEAKATLFETLLTVQAKVFSMEQLRDSINDIITNMHLFEQVAFDVIPRINADVTAQFINPKNIEAIAKNIKAGFDDAIKDPKTQAQALNAISKINELCIVHLQPEGKYKEAITLFSTVLDYLLKSGQGLALFNDPQSYLTIYTSPVTLSAQILEITKNIQRTTLDSKILNAFNNQLIAYAQSINKEPGKRIEMWSAQQDLTRAIRNLLELPSIELTNEAKSTLLPASMNFIRGASIIRGKDGKLDIKEFYKTPFKTGPEFSRYELLGEVESIFTLLLNKKAQFNESDFKLLQTFKNQDIAAFRKAIQANDFHSEIEPNFTIAQAADALQKTTATKAIILKELDALSARMDMIEALNKGDYAKVANVSTSALQEFPVFGNEGQARSFAHHFIENIVPKITSTITQEQATTIVKALWRPEMQVQLPRADYITLMTSKPIIELLKKAGNSAKPILEEAFKALNKPEIFGQKKLFDDKQLATLKIFINEQSPKEYASTSKSTEL